MIDFALHYAKTGWPVFPLVAGGKMPAIPKRLGGHGCLDATLDRQLIESWWLQYPDANVGIATGRRSGLLVVDVDPRKTSDWLESVSALKLPPTRTVRTASSGYHLYFSLPAESQISIGTNLLPGIDWRADGGYVVSAGSIVNGVTYGIARNCAIVAAPKALLDRIKLHGKGSRVAARDESGHMVIPDGKRNEHLARIAGALRRFGIEYNAIYEALRAVNTDHCMPAMDERDLRTIAASISNYAPAEGLQADRGANSTSLGIPCKPRASGKLVDELQGRHAE